MKLPVYERRFYLSQLTKEAERREEEMERNREKQSTSNGSGKRQTRVSGMQLKNKLKNGDIPLK